ncbi:MAG: ABC-2 type transport system permease protein [Verrucomicrobia bacterium]|jgi:ABC-2 type transport system permease protein|nr:MAG: ABC-2 type transport system permease protein [Verrucomicrobiota bacterium]
MSRRFLILLQRELAAFFFSPMAYFILAMVMGLNGVAFRFATALMDGRIQPHSLVSLTFNSFWFRMIFFFLFPLLTMRLFAEERKMGTFETLMTAPVRVSEVVLSKYLACLLFYCALWVPVLGNFLLFRMITGSSTAFPDGALFSSALLLLLLGAFNIALGCLASALSRNQIVAAVAGGTLVLLHFFLGFLAGFAKVSTGVLERVNYFSSLDHINLFAQGLIDSRPVIYYLSTTLFLLALTHQAIEHRRGGI